MKEKTRVSFYVDKKSRLVHDAVVFMCLSAIFRLIGCWDMWGDRIAVCTQILLPVTCNLLFIFCIRVLGEKAFPSTILPVLLGVVFFIMKAMSFDNMLHTLLCIALYITIAVLYTTTALGMIRTKWLLVPLFGLPFLYHVFVEDAAALRNAEDPLLFTEGMQELSVLAIMLALLFTALAMKKRKTVEEPVLPKIKDPIVLIPKKKNGQPPATEEKPETGTVPVSTEKKPETVTTPALTEKPEPEAEPLPSAEPVSDSGSTELPGESTETLTDGEKQTTAEQQGEI